MTFLINEKTRIKIRGLKKTSRINHMSLIRERLKYQEAQYYKQHS